MRLTLPITLALLSATALATAAQAQDGGAGMGDYVLVGAGVTAEYEGSDETKTIPFAGFRYQAADNLVVETNGPGVKLSFGAGGLDLGVAARYRGDRDPIPALGLAKIDSTVELGGSVGVGRGEISAGRVSAKLEGLVDVGGAHDGYTLTPSLGYSIMPARNVVLMADVGVTYASEDYMRTYFATPGYAPGAGFKDASVGVTGIYMFNQNWGMAGRVDYKRLLGDAADSPVVQAGSDSQVMAGAGVVYRF